MRWGKCFCSPGSGSGIMAICSHPCGGGRDERGLPTSRTCLAEVVTQLIVKTGFVYVLKKRQGWRNGQMGAGERRNVVRGSVTYWRDWSWAVGGRLWTEMEEPWIYWGACTWSQRQWDANFWLVHRLPWTFLAPPLEVPKMGIIFCLLFLQMKSYFNFHQTLNFVIWK